MLVENLTKKYPGKSYEEQILNENLAFMKKIEEIVHHFNNIKLYLSLLPKDVFKMSVIYIIDEFLSYNNKNLQYLLTVAEKDPNIFPLNDDVVFWNHIWSKFISSESFNPEISLFNNNNKNNIDNNIDYINNDIENIVNDIENIGNNEYDNNDVMANNDIIKMLKTSISKLLVVYYSKKHKKLKNYDIIYEHCLMNYYFKYSMVSFRKLPHSKTDLYKQIIEKLLNKGIIFDCDSIYDIINTGNKEEYNFLTSLNLNSSIIPPIKKYIDSSVLPSLNLKFLFDKILKKLSYDDDETDSCSCDDSDCGRFSATGSQISDDLDENLMFDDNEYIDNKKVTNNKENNNENNKENKENNESNNENNDSKNESNNESNEENNKDDDEYNEWYVENYDEFLKLINEGAIIGDDLFEKALKHGNIHIIKLLLDNGAKVGLKYGKRYRDYYSPLDFVTRGLVVGTLNKLYRNYYSALDFVSLGPIVDTLIKLYKILLEYGADINEINNEIRTPLNSVIIIENLSVIKFLINNDAKIDYTIDEHSNPYIYPLVSAIFSKKILSIKLLLECGATTNILNIQPQKFLSRMSKRAGPEIIQLLTQYGFNNTLINNL